ncbi:sigma E protease regulator RseP [Shewanella sp. 202IG2-18]|uniref:sigma E protease regulator RseP n=1 Tax=Parashewanella hymeniacidonis TaxID=2807618 RepID=UPI001961D13E|nr:sigma E protease regulator RseP [Parashewanella hymeniacidonis]MBM7071772.1 sigma E protease regulator RseP [Parashewanella hymeniacidonis]
MMDFLWNLGAFIVALGILVTAHEYGHFWVARKCGVKVERFSVGFGKAIWKRTAKDGTEYVIAMIPLGGYVKMLDERVEEVPEHLLDQAFNRKSVWQRIAVVAAGPIANFLFAIFVLFIMYFIGVPSLKPVIDGTKSDSPASKIIVNEPTQILSIDGKAVRDWEEANLALVGEIGAKELTIKVAPLSQNVDLSADDEFSQSQGKAYRLDTRNWKFDPDKESAITALGLNVYRPKVEPIVAKVSEGSSAQLAGVMVNDKIISIDGQPYEGWGEFVKLIQSSPEKNLKFVVERAGQRITLNVVPKSVTNADGKPIGLVGIAPKQPKWPESMRIQMEYGIVGSFVNALDRTWELTAVSLKTMAKLFTGDVSVKSLSGPISIAQGAGRSADYGFVRFLGFLALISVSLGIINLMPVPILDGGHLLFYFVEVITGKPVPEKVQDIGFRIGAALLLVLMSVALFNDFSRL